MARRREEQEARQVVDAAELLDLQATMEDVTVSPEVGRYCVALARATREHANVLMGSSPRGSLALLLVGRAYAVLRGRDYLTPDDVKAVAPAVLEHRVVIRPELLDERGLVAHRRRRAPPQIRAHPADRRPLVVTSPWRPTRALGRALAVGLLVLVAAAFGGRGDLAVIGAPLAALVAWSLVTRPQRPPTVTSPADPGGHPGGRDGRLAPGRQRRARPAGRRRTAPRRPLGHHDTRARASGGLGHGRPDRAARGRGAERQVGRATPGPGTGASPWRLRGLLLDVARPARREHPDGPDAGHLHLAGRAAAPGRARRAAPVEPSRGRDRAVRHPALPHGRPAPPDPLARVAADGHSPRHDDLRRPGRRGAGRRRRDPGPGRAEPRHRAPVEPRRRRRGSRGRRGPLPVHRRPRRADRAGWRWPRGGAGRRGAPPARPRAARPGARRAEPGHRR